MGMYINPPDMTKEEFLAKHGIEVRQDIALAHNYDTMLPVCLINNGGFTAAGIGYHPMETAEFANPRDPRPKRWFLVPKVNLKPYME